MDIEDLINKPASECSDEELEKQAHLLSKLRIVTVKKTSSKKTPKSNANKRVEDLLSKLPPEKVKALLAKLTEAKP